MPPKTPPTHGVLETCLYVNDLDAAERFYTDVLGLTLVSSEEDRHRFFRCGDRMLLLFNPDATADVDSDDPDALPSHGAHGVCHVAFSVTPDELDAWRDYLAAKGIEIEKEHRWGDRGRSLYFRDPDGNSLEVACPAIWGL